MFIIGELINGMYKSVSGAISNRDKSLIQKCALDQIAAGAHALDVNCGPGSRRPIEDIQWLVKSIREVTDTAIVIDSSKPEVIEAGLQVVTGKVIINSTTADPEKLALFLPLAKKYNAGLIGLALNAKGVPQNKDQRLELAAAVVSACVDAGFPADQLYLDPIVMPVNVGQSQMSDILESIKEFKIISEPSPWTVIGLSNVSQGARFRSLINRTFLTMAVFAGLDAVILDPLDKELMDSLITAELIVNKQIYCDSYLQAYRKS